MNRVKERALIDTAPFSGIADPVSSISHLGGAVVFAMLGLALVRRAYGNRLRVVAVAVYVSGVVFALCASGLFHLAAHGTSARTTLQTVDHAAIFFLIAATYTPVHVIEFKGFMRWGMLAIIWSAAATGIMLKIVFSTDIPPQISLFLYLGLGWTGLISATALYRMVGFAPLRPLIAGALAYTIGALLEFNGVPNFASSVVGPHEIFHVFVLVGVGMHWAYIRRIVIYAPITDLYQQP